MKVEVVLRFHHGVAAADSKDWPALATAGPYCLHGVNPAFEHEPVDKI